MAKYDKSLLRKDYLPVSSDPIGAEGTVPVDLTIRMWVRQADWEAEHSIDATEEGYDFEGVFKENMHEDILSLHELSDEWPNIEGMDLLP